MERLKENTLSLELLMMVAGRILSPRIADESVENMVMPPAEWQKLYTIIRSICLLISIFGIIGNGMLIYLLSCRIKKTSFTIYVLNISIADFLLIFNYFIENILFFKPTRLTPFISHLRFMIYIMGNDATIYFLTIITVERYLMVFFPAWYHSHRPKHFTVLMCVILWVLSFIITLLDYSSCHPRHLFNLNLKCDTVITIHFIYNFLNFISVMLFSTAALLTRIQRPLQGNFPTRLDISIMTAVLRTLIFWVPIRIVDFLHLWVVHEHLPDHYAVSLIFENIYSSVGPYIYLAVGWWKSQELQRSIHIFIERALKHTEENTSTAAQEDQEQA